MPSAMPELTGKRRSIPQEHFQSILGKPSIWVTSQLLLCFLTNSFQEISVTLLARF